MPHVMLPQPETWGVGWAEVLLMDMCVWVAGHFGGPHPLEEQ